MRLRVARGGRGFTGTQGAVAHYSPKPNSHAIAPEDLESPPQPLGHCYTVFLESRENASLPNWRRDLSTFDWDNAHVTQLNLFGRIAGPINRTESGSLQAYAHYTWDKKNDMTRVGFEPT